MQGEGIVVMVNLLLSESFLHHKLIVQRMRTLLMARLRENFMGETRGVSKGVRGE